MEDSEKRGNKMNRYFIAYAEGDTIQQLQEEINKMIDQDFILYGFPFASNGKHFQCMKKDIPDTITSSVKAYEEYIRKKNERPYRPPRPGRDRANG